MTFIARTTAIAAALLATSVYAGGNAEAGKTKADTCMGCHGIEHYTNAYPTYRVPRIAGQHEAYLTAALNAYKNGDRQHPTMRAQGSSLSAEDIADISAYFANLER